MTIGGETRRVLVVDDDQGMREAIESLLLAAGFNPAVYASAEDLLATETPKTTLCVISDVHLPGMSGLDLISELRRRGWQQMVIVITAYDSPDGRLEAERRGAARYFAKPFAGSELLGVIGLAAARACFPAIT